MTAPDGREITLTLSTGRPGTRAAGMIRVTTPAAPGWAEVAQGFGDLGRVARNAFREAQVAEYAAGQATAYDRDDTDAFDDVDRSGRKATRTGPLIAPDERVGTAGPRHRLERWRLLDDGQLLSPAGRKYPPDTATGLSVLRRLADTGVNLPPALQAVLDRRPAGGL